MLTALRSPPQSSSLGVLNLHLHPKQWEAFETVATEVLYGGAAGGGKALAIDTPIATPSGWTAMGDLQVGDQIFDENGDICRVVAATEPMVGRPCYRIEFCDGAEIVADAQHQWLTFDDREREAERRRTDDFRASRRASRASRGTGKRLDLAAANSTRLVEYLSPPLGSIVTTEEISKTLIRNGRTNHSIDVCPGLNLEAANLPLAPYILGVWLGDGTCGQGAITTADSQIVSEIEFLGFEVRKRPSGRYGYGIIGLQKKLRDLGVLQDKHIPQIYLRGSVGQRFELLRGLMDTDGTINSIGQCEFDNCNRALIEGVQELLFSLGIKARICEGRAKLDGCDCGPRYRLKFTTVKKVFILKRKSDRLPSFERGTQHRRMIKAATPIKSVPVRCIEVDSASRLFLAGREMIPTHNSHLMRVAAIVWCSAIAGLQVYLFRRIRSDLIKNHMEGPKGFRAMLAGWYKAGLCNIVEDEIRFWNGSKIFLCNCAEESDVYKYQGAEMHVLLIDELTHFSEWMYRFLRRCNRMVGLTIPPEYAGRFPRIVSGANPGNIGHLWVKSSFVSVAVPSSINRQSPAEGGMLRQYIPARLEDNPSLADDDPGYEQRLEGLGSKSLVQAMRWGDWDVVEGAFFDCWSPQRHVVRPFEVPSDWDRFRSGDWGSASPFSFGWWAIVVEKYKIESGLWLPRGCIVRYREWYGMRPGQPNVGLKLTAEKVGEGIRDREKSDPKMKYGVLDPSAFKEDGGPSIAERIMTATGHKVLFTPADNARVPGRGAMGGWDQMRARMVGDSDGLPMIVFFSTCLDSIRTIPVLQHDADRPEDLDTDAEDHCFVGSTLVETCNGSVPIEVLAEHNPVGILHSIHHREFYRGARLTRRKASLVKLIFENGREILCTPDHKFLVDLDDWRYVVASDLAGESVECSRSLLAEQSRNLMESATISAVDTFSAAAGAFISLYGSIITAKCQKVFTFITRTMIGHATVLKTSNALRYRTILVGSMGRRVGDVECAVLERPMLQLPRGMDRRQGGNGTPSISLNTFYLQWPAAFLRFAGNVVSHIWSVPQKSLKENSAVEHARRVRCVSVERLNEQQDVYCLTVPANAHFAIEGGLLVRNCADDARYACMSRPWVKAVVKPSERKIDDYTPRNSHDVESFKVM